MRILFLVHQKDIPYVKYIKTHSPAWLSSGKVLANEKISYLSELDFLAKANNAEAIITTDYKVLQVLFPDKKFKDPDTDGAGLSVMNFQGNMIRTKTGLPVLILAPLRHLAVVKFAPFLWRHFFDKLDPKSKKFINLSAGKPRDLIPQNGCDFENALYLARKSRLISFDIETSTDQKISHISFSLLLKNSSRIINIGFEIDDLVKWNYIKQILLTDPPKIAQNGRYDIVHLLHWNAPVKNFLYDTHGMMQCWYSELKRDLAFIGSFFIRDLLYWKDEISGDKLLYNMKDANVTLLAAIQWMLVAPQWAKDNYGKVFPVVFPCISAEMEGLKVDPKIWNSMAVEQRAIIQDSKEKLNKLLGKKYFNPNSPKQVLSLLHVLAPKERIESSDEATLKSVAFRHPLNAMLIQLILDYREALKLFTTYIDAMLWHQRVTYSINPFGTETGRSSSSKSSFNLVTLNSKGNTKYESYGAQLQNIPAYFKKCLVADEGFLICELDKSQAESRCTAYEAQEPALIYAVEHSPDFHCQNASAFFGIPFEELYDVATHTKLNILIRDLAKRVNHGANYNMGEHVLIQTMGEHNLWQAKSLLKLPASYGLKGIARHLLETFDRTYPRLRGKENGWYGELILEWKKTHCLRTHDGWTRYFFGDPTASKSYLNELVAHKPQHTNVAMVNNGWVQIFLQLDLKYPDWFRTKGQVHDSILFQVHQDHQDLIKKAQEIYDSTSTLVVHGKEMFIPSDLSGPKISWK